MADAGQYEKVRDIVTADPERRVVVVSAAGKRFSKDHKITDLLYLCHAHIQYGVPCDPIYETITSRYIEIREKLGIQMDLESEFAELKSRLDAKQVSKDEMASRGEYFSAKLMAAFLGFDFVDASQWVYFTIDGKVDTEKTYAALKEKAKNCKGIVIPGFYGVMPDGSIRTFSRGGSDITGSLAAAALDADVYENWTDVSGILMADPRIVENSRPIAEITYEELRELAYAGANVLHEDAIYPVREKNIPLNIRNTNAPEDPGTMICKDFDTEIDTNRIITGIAGKKDFSIITVFKRGLTKEVGILRRILLVMEKHNISVEFVPNGMDNVSLAIPTDKVSPHLYAILADIQQDIAPDNITVHDQIAVITAVGHQMVFRPGVSGKIFAALGEAGINIRMITQGPDELNIIFGVDNKDFDNAIRVLYNSFIK